MQWSRYRMIFKKLIQIIVGAVTEIEQGKAKANLDVFSNTLQDLAAA